MKHNSPSTWQFLATISFALLLTVPFFYATKVDAIESNVSTDVFDSGAFTTVGIEAGENLLGIQINELDEAVIVDATSTGSALVACVGPTNLRTLRIFPANLATLDTELQTFGSAFGSVNAEVPPQAICDEDPLPGGEDVGEGLVRWIYYLTIPDRSKFVDAEAIRFIVHADSPYEIVTGAAIYKQSSFTGGQNQLDDVILNTGVDFVVKGSYGSVITIPITTSQRLLVQALGDSPATHAEWVQIQTWLRFEDMPSDGEGIIFDMELVRTQDRVITSINQRSIVNILLGTAILVASAFALKSVTFAGFQETLMDKDRKGGA